MKPVTREQWTTALRSGDYAQTTGVLYRQNQGYCCLGVLMHLAGAKPNPGGSGLKVNDLKTPHDAYIPDEVARMVGISRDTQRYLAMKNDSRHSFNDIADYIDQLPFDQDIEMETM